MRLSDYASAEELVTIESIERNTVLFKDGGLRQILMIDGVNTALKSEEEQNALIFSYQNFLNSIDFPVQIVVHSRKVNIQRYLDTLDRRAREESAPLLKNQIQEYRSFVEGFVRENAIMQKLFLIVVPFNPIIIPTKGPAGFHLNPFHKKNEEEAREETERRKAAFEENLAQLAQRVSQVSDGLRAAGLQATLLNDEELVDLYYNFYNPEPTEREQLPLPDEPQQSFTQEHHEK